MTLGAHGSEPSMIAGWPRGSRIPQVLQGGVRGVGSVCGVKWSRDLTHCQRFPHSGFTVWPSLHNYLEACCGDGRDA